MEEVIIISDKEKRQDFLYVLILFIIAASLLIWIVFRNNSIDIHTSANSNERAGWPPDNAAFIDAQHDWVPVFDTSIELIKKIKSVDDETDPIISDINYNIVRIRNQRNDIPGDTTTNLRFGCFTQMETFLNHYKDQFIKLYRIKINIEKLKSHPR